MLKKVVKGIIFLIIMAGAVYAAEGFTEMIIDEYKSVAWSIRSFGDNMIRFIQKDWDGIILYLFLEFSLVFTAFNFGNKTLDLFRKEEKES